MSFDFKAILKFNGAQAVTGMNKASKGFSKMKGQVGKLNASLGKMGQGLKGVGIAALPMTVGLGLATKEAADFDAQMSSTQAVMLASKDEMIGLRNEAKRLGATTAFSAKEAAEGQQLLAQAGFTAKQINAALPGVLDAAAASGEGLGTVADIVAGQLGAFGLSADKAVSVADTLALTTSLTNTNFTQLAEGMKFVAPAAKTAGLSLAETAMSLGVLANAGIKGSLAGTAMKNALLKLTKPTKKALELFGGRKGMNAALFELDKNGKKRLKPMASIMATVAKATQRAKNPIDAMAVASEIFGIRGSAALSAFSGAMLKTQKVTPKSLAQIQKGVIAIEATGQKVGDSIKGLKVGDILPQMEALRFRLAGAEGSAKAMAKIKLDNLKGQFTLFQSAVSGLGIEIGSLVDGDLKGLVTRGGNFLSVIVTGFQAAQNGGKLTAGQLKSLKDNEFKDLIKSSIEFAQGFIEGFKEIKETGKEVFLNIVKFLKPIFGGADMTAKSFGKMVSKIVLIGAIAAPVIGALAAGLFILWPILVGIGGLISFIGSAFAIVGTIVTTVGGILSAIFTAATLPLLGIIAAVVAVGVAIFVFRDEIFSALTPVMDFFKGMWNVIKFGAALAFLSITETIKGLANIIMPILQPTIDFFKVMWLGIKTLAIGAFNGIKEPALSLVTSLMNAFKGFGKFIVDVVMSPFRLVFGLIKDIVGGLADTFIGRQALKLAGIDASQLKESLNSLPSFDVKPEVEAKIASSQGTTKKLNEEIINQGNKQQAITQPPSAEQNAQAIKSSIPQAQESQGGGGQSMKVIVEGRIRGNDLNLMMVKSQINNSERNGRFIDPAIKRKRLQNGAVLGGE